MKNLLFTFALLILATKLSFAQGALKVNAATVDSLQQLVNSHPQEDEKKVSLLNEYARQCFYNQEILKGFIATREARDLSKKLNFEGGKIMYYLTLAAYHGNGNADMFTYYKKQAQWLSRSKGDVLSAYYIDLKIPKPIAENQTPDFKTLLAKFSSVLQYFEKLDDKEIEANILNAKGHYTYNLKKWEDYLNILDRIIKLYTDVDQIYPAFLYSTYKMNILKTLGKEDESKAIELKLVKLFAKNENENAIGLIATSMGGGYANNGRYILAIEYYLKAIDIFEQNGDNEMLSNSYYWLGLAYENLEMNSKAYESYEKCLSILKQINDSVNINTTYGTAVFPLIALGKYDKAKEYMSYALRDSVNTDKDYLMARHNDAQGQILKNQGKFEEAIPHFKKALDGFIKSGKGWATPFEALYISECYFHMKDYEAALEYGLKCLDLETALYTNESKTKKNITLLLSKIYEKLGNKTTAFSYLKTHQEMVANSEKLDELNRLADAEVQSILEKSQKELDALEKEKRQSKEKNKIQRLWIFSITGALLSAIVLALILFRNNKSKQKANSLLQEQKIEIQNTYEKLKETQTQLIQSEKMASLGELTAGIAHEIQNPLNFVNNFSEVNKELVDELQQELKSGKFNDAIEISNDIKANEEKINHHGKRADAIVKGMLQHSRSSSGVKEATDINALCDEYLRLSYHGLRAKDKSFNATLKTDFDETIGNINIIPQDIGRVILNLITNAFYEVDKKKKRVDGDYNPTVSVSTKKENGNVMIQVMDNADGIPQKILEKIFQPFFTTKPTGQGTGLGLSLSYDIVKAHGGELKVETKKGEGSEFIIQLPVV